METKNSFKPKEFERKCWHCGTIFIGLGGARYCSKKCHIDYYTDKSAGPDACWRFTGTTYGKNHKHAKLTINGVREKVQTHVWIQNYGGVPKGMMVTNICGNSLCVNPKHLTLTEPHNNIQLCRHCSKPFKSGPNSVYCSLECVFDAKVDKTSDPNGCWIWTGYMNSANRHSFMCVDCKTYSPFRFSYEKHNSAIEDNNLIIFSTCGNPRCVNPEHLSVRDIRRGENNSYASLTAEHVENIYTSDKSITELAKEYNITCGNIYNIRNDKSWTHLTSELTKPAKVNRLKIRLEKDQIIDIYFSSKTAPELSKEYNISTHTVYRIRQGKSWPNITKDLINPRNKGEHKHE